MKRPAAWLRIVSIATASLFASAACAPPPAEPAFTFNVKNVGKADGASGVLSPDDIARIKDAFTAAIQKGEAKIKDLEAQIASLEAQAKQKQAEIDSLVAQIEQRKSQIERNFKLQVAASIGLGLLTLGLGSLIAGAGAVASLAAAIASDSDLKALNSKLADARAAQTAMRAQADQYRLKKQKTMVQLDAIRSSKARLVATLDSPAVASTVALAKYPSAAAPYQQWKVMEEILAATQSEIGKLVELKAAAVELVAALDAALGVLHQLSTDAEKLADDSRDGFFKILEAALTGDPLAVATAWVSGQLADETAKVLTDLHIPFADFVGHLVRTRFTGTPEDVAKLEQYLLDKLAGKIVDELSLSTSTGPSGTTVTPPPAAPPASTYTSTQSVAIPDENIAESTIAVAGTGTGTRHITHATVHVTLDHTYVGDLVLAVEHGGQLELLSRTTPDDAKHLDETFELLQYGGADATGDWTLWVSDEAPADDGTLRGWSLTLSAE